jgi:CRISPR-associated protein Csc2
MQTLTKYSDWLAPRYENYPRGRYVTLVLVRHTESETIFRTEGSGEGLVKDTVQAGLSDQRPIRRVVISKRKQTAVERRTGRELLRAHTLLHPAGRSGEPCALNTNAPCGKCIDCYLYGFAVGGGGAQRSRVLTDDAYSIAPASQVTDKRTFNAIFETGTMRDGERVSSAINEDEFVRPGVHFLDMETLKDVTLGELQYVIGNVLRSTRYGAISSRQGRIQNTIAQIIFTDTELFSNLELTQAVYDIVCNGAAEPPFPLAQQAVLDAVHKAVDELLPRVPSRTPARLSPHEVTDVVRESGALYANPQQVHAFLSDIDGAYLVPTGK